MCKTETLRGGGGREVEGEGGGSERRLTPDT